MDSLVSILIPCNNAAVWLAETLESALSQTWPHKEVILVDDGSTDNSLEVADRFRPRGVRIITQHNQGASAARNRAIAESRGDWLQFLDADDLLALDKIEEQMRMVPAIGSGALICARWSRFRRTPDDATFAPVPLCVDATPVDWVIQKLSGSSMMHPGAWLVSRQLAIKAGPWNTKLTLDDDGEYFTRAVLASSAVRLCPTSVSYYRSQIPNSLSARLSPDAFRSAYLSATLCANHLIASEDSSRTHRACADMFMRLTQTIYPECLDLVRDCENQVHNHGGSTEVFYGGKLFRLASGLIGWKLAKRIQKIRALLPKMPS